MASIPAFTSTTRKPTLMRSPKSRASACCKHFGQENGQGLLVLGISDDVVEGHAGSVAAHHDAAQNLCLAFTSLTAGEKHSPAFVSTDFFELCERWGVGEK